MQFDKKKCKFYLKYCVIPEKLPEMLERLKSINLALTLNPDLAQEAKAQLIKEYPFTKDFFK